MKPKTCGFLSLSRAARNRRIADTGLPLVLCLGLALLAGAEASAALDLNWESFRVRLLTPAGALELPNKYRSAVEAPTDGHRLVVESDLSVIPPLLCQAVQRRVYSLRELGADFRLELPDVPAGGVLPERSELQVLDASASSGEVAENGLAGYFGHLGALFAYNRNPRGFLEFESFGEALTGHFEFSAEHGDAAAKVKGRFEKIPVPRN